MSNYDDIDLYIPPLVSGNRLVQYVSVKDPKDDAEIKMAGYIRVSTRKESQVTSIENQEKYLKEWADLNKYNIIKFYIDIKTGAYTYLRNEMMQMRDDISSGVVRGVVTKEISRTSRDIMDVIELKRKLADHGAFLISIKERYDSREDDDEFLLILYAGLAQKERKVTSGRVKITQLMKAREGKTNVPSPAFGYKLSNDRQYLVIDSLRSDIYKMIVKKYLDDWNLSSICEWLNQTGVPTKRNRRWKTNSVRAILVNPVYLGMTIYNATVLVRDSEGRCRRFVRPRSDWIIRYHTHEPLITESDFKTIGETVRRNKRQYYRKQITLGR